MARKWAAKGKVSRCGSVKTHKMGKKENEATLGFGLPFLALLL